MKDKIALYISALVFLLMALPYLLPGADAYIRIHDTLEGEWIWLHLLVESGNAFNLSWQAIVPQAMGGLPRALYPTPFNLNLLLVYLLGAYNAYIVAHFIYAFAGFLCMRFLCQKWIFQKESNKHLATYVGLLFALIPFFTPFGLSVMAQPLLLYIFCELFHYRGKWWHWGVLILLPFASSIVWLGLPACVLLGLFWVYKLAKTKQWHWQFIGGVFWLGIVFIATNYQIIFYPALHPEFVSHREAYDAFMFGSPNFLDAFSITFTHIFTLHYHVGTVFTVLILLLAFFAIKSGNRYLNMTHLLMLFFAICIFQGFELFLEYYGGQLLPFFKTFRLNRFNIFLPLVLFLMLGLVLLKLDKSTILKKTIPFLLVSQGLITAFGNDELLHNYRTLFRVQTFPTYSQYLAPKQFKQIKNAIGRPAFTYKVASLGISPTIAQYNGFYTLDGLQSLYPLSYKQEFAKLMQGEIKKSKAIQQYFGGWGNRCYLFSSELGVEYTAYQNQNKFKDRAIQDYYFNSQQFYKMGGRFLLSAVKINNAKATGLKLFGIFESGYSWWKIYVYKAVPYYE